ncbi:hypothetical protein CR513_18813, partial [Mucuna pruriens]
MKRMFLEKFFPASRTTSIRKEICDISQHSGETLENKIVELTSLIRKLAIGQHQISSPVRECGIYASIEHPTDVCPTLQETEPNNAEVATMMDEFHRGFDEANGYKQHSISTKCDYHKSRVIEKLATIVNALQSKGSKQTPSQTILSPQANRKEMSLQFLRKYRNAISWTLVNLPGINPSIYMHKILLEQEAQPIRKP